MEIQGGSAPISPKSGSAVPSVSVEITASSKNSNQYMVKIAGSNQEFPVTIAGKQLQPGTKVELPVTALLQSTSHSKYEFYDDESSIETFSLKYRTNKPTMFQIKDEFYKDNEFFYNDAKVKHIKCVFPLQGYTYKFEMQKKYDDIKYFKSLYFNDQFPALKRTINITVPDWLSIDLKEFNFEGYKIGKTQKRDVKNNCSIYTYTLENIVAFHDEENSPGKSYVYPHILIIPKSFKNGSVENSIFGSIKDLYKWYKSIVEMLKDDPSVFKSKVDELISKAKTDEEKIKNIYYWVQDNIKYIAFEDGIAGFKPDESNNVFQKKYGDCKGMANLIKQMLKLAGFDARLSWIGTKHIAYDYTSPTLLINNHMICTLFFKGKKYYLDGTEKYNAFEKNAERIQNKEVLIEDGDNYIIEKIPSSTSDLNKEVRISNLILDNEKLKGEVSRQYSGECGSQFLYIYNNLKSDRKGETLENYLSNGDRNINVVNVKTSDLNNRDQNLLINYNIEIANKISGFDNELYIDLEFMNEYRKFNLKDRKTDYEFGYKTDYESVINLKIPAGYKVVKLPKDLYVKEDNFEVKISYTTVGDKIVYSKKFIFKNAVIKANEIEKWNAFNKNLVENYNQQITISKQ